MSNIKKASALLRHLQQVDVSPDAAGTRLRLSSPLLLSASAGGLACTSSGLLTASPATSAVGEALDH